MIPVRCFTCGKVLGHLESCIDSLKENGYNTCEILNMLKLYRYCCRSVIMTYT